MQIICYNSIVHWLQSQAHEEIVDYVSAGEMMENWYESDCACEFTLLKSVSLDVEARHKKNGEEIVRFVRFSEPYALYLQRLRFLWSHSANNTSDGDHP